MTDDVNFLTLPDRRLAYQQRRANPDKTSLPGLFFLCGFASDMTGSKACFLDERAAEAGLGLTRFDYRGHGRSSGAFTDGTIGGWLEDALFVLDRLTQGPQILVGSSMGGWIAMRILELRPERVAGFIGIAAAPDFTEDQILPSLTETQKRELATQGFILDPDAPPDHAPPITAALLEEAKGQLVLRKPLPFSGPVSLLQGQRDREVPWRQALKIMDTIQAEDVRLTLVKDAEHRFSRPQDLALLWREVGVMLGCFAGPCAIS